MGCAVDRRFPATAVESDLSTSGDLVTAFQPMTCRFCRPAERRLSRMATAVEERHTETACASDTHRLPGAVRARTLIYVLNRNGRVFQHPSGCGRARLPSHSQNPVRGPRCGMSPTTPCGDTGRENRAAFERPVADPSRAPGKFALLMELLLYYSECTQATVLLAGDEQNLSHARPFGSLLRGTRRERILAKRHVAEAFVVCNKRYETDTPAKRPDE